MIEQDKIAFRDMMNSVTTIYNKQHLDKDTLRIWFSKLQRFDFPSICKAFDRWVDSEKKMPTPTDIISLCQVKFVEFAKLPKPAISAEHSKKYIENLHRVIAEVNAQLEKPKDMKEWARRILKNPNKYPAISAEFAKEALYGI
jgi:predicted transglutaminase-like cysteine proteinase